MLNAITIVHSYCADFRIGNGNAWSGLNKFQTLNVFDPHQRVRRELKRLDEYENDFNFGNFGSHLSLNLRNPLTSSSLESTGPFYPDMRPQGPSASQNLIKPAYPGNIVPIRNNILPIVQNHPIDNFDHYGSSIE